MSFGASAGPTHAIGSSARALYEVPVLENTDHESGHVHDHDKKDYLPDGSTSPSLGNDGDERSLDHDQDVGVTRIQALYIVFGKGWKIWLLYGSIALLCSVYALSSSTTYVYLAFATSAYEAHALVGTIAVVTSIMAAVAQPFVAKIADITSRPWAFVMSIAFYCLGYAITAGSNTVGAVCAGQLLYTVGTTGLGILITIILGDITTLQWRGVANGLAALPYVATAFIAGYITDAISLSNWRWGYGMFVIIVPVALAPALIILFWADMRAKKLGALSLAQSSYAVRQAQANLARKSYAQMMLYYVKVIDGFGLVLLGTSFALIFVPFTLYASAVGGWKNPSMIAMMVVGGLTMIAFFVWELRFAKHPLMPKRVLNKTFICCVVIDFMYYLSGYVIDVYFSSWIYVVKDWSTREYTFFLNTQTVGLCTFGLVAGLAMRYTHTYKSWQLGGLVVRILGMGLNYYASLGHASTAVLVCSRTFISVGGAFSVVASTVASQASVPHQDMALAISLLALYTSLGGSIGQAVSAAVWTDRLPVNLDKYLGSSLNSTQIAEIYGSIVVARLAEPRDQVILAYNATYAQLSLGALISSFASLIAGVMTTNLYLGDTQNAIEGKKLGLGKEEELSDEEIARRAREVEERAKMKANLQRTSV